MTQAYKSHLIFKQSSLHISTPDLGPPPTHQLLPAHCDMRPVIISKTFFSAIIEMIIASLIALHTVILQVIQEPEDANLIFAISYELSTAVLTISEPGFCMNAHISLIGWRVVIS